MKRPVGWVVTVAALALILAATLRSVPAGTHECPILRPLCSEFAGRDVVYNVLGFAPLGLGLGLLGLSPVAALVTGLALALGIELIQALALQGRSPSLFDVIANGLGAAAGVWAARARRLLDPLTPRGAGRLATGWATVLSVWFAVAAVLLQPSFPEAPWYGQWAADLGMFERFRGSLVGASIGGAALPRARFDPALQAASSKLPFTLEARVRGAPPTGRLAPIVSIYDADSRKVAILGQEGTALVFEPRTRIDDLRLTPVGFRLAGGLLVGAPNGNLTVLGRFDGRRVSLEAAGPAGERERSTRLAPAMVWRALMPFRVTAGRVTAWIDWLALAIGFFPLGYLLARAGTGRPGGRTSWAAGLLAAGVALVPLPFGLLPAPAGIGAGVLVGWAGGWAVGRAASRETDRR